MAEKKKKAKVKTKDVMVPGQAGHTIIDDYVTGPLSRLTKGWSGKPKKRKK